MPRTGHSARPPCDPPRQLSHGWHQLAPLRGVGDRLDAVVVEDPDAIGSLEPNDPLGVELVELSTDGLDGQSQVVGDVTAGHR